MTNVAPLDRLSPLLDRFRVRASLFHNGPLCGVTRFDARPGRGFLHVMRNGEMEVHHAADSGLVQRVVVREPSLVFYPRPLAHDFHNAPTEGSDFVCATLDFEQGDAHPLVQALPPLVVLPLARVTGINETLSLLFGEAERVRCGQRLLADRLFEVLLLQLLRWMLDQRGAPLPVGLLNGLAHPRLARALTAAHARPGDAWTLERLAAEAGMSRSRFAEAFREVVGSTPADYLADWRLTIARAELRAGKPLKLLATELGYANASALSRLFTQRHEGLSPRAWLQRS
ncbi:AraC family transcriptional regulator [Roseateles asaccharophilus]|uniref:AraC-like DNA-binding protein n=1 Tax=Roseateles asaccharophilus TaxID=582607 RepID=A0ABU2AAN2_9BURK|nr:AraC family transcriptional regulator [Roseateles asaccharophilus]MDR7334264.1 AraC-like DNA-binding protein [Roseateles asaccharophilus]